MCKALHDHARYRVRVHRGVSDPWTPQRGLREGDPSSPPLFNVFHDAVLRDFRLRRKRRAEEMDRAPGIPWVYQIDGKLKKTSEKRQQIGRDTVSSFESCVLGDAGFADDTMLAGLEDEMEDAEEILMTTMGDWEEKVNKGKTEKLRMTGGRRAPYDVRREFETEVVRHLGAMHREDGDRCADTGKRISVAHALVRAIAKGWSIGTSHGRGRESGIDIPTRLQVLESCVMGALLFGCRTRGWTGFEVTKMQRVANYAVRRAFGMDTILMEELGLSDASMVKAAQWRTVEDRISRLSLSWLGHVARMPVWRHPKQVLFGFIEGRGGSEERNLRAWHTRWLRTRIRKLHTHEMDWFRIACNRKAWRRAVDKAYPATGTTSERRRELRRWRPGQPLPGGEAEVPPPSPSSGAGGEVQVPRLWGDIRHGA